MKTRGLVAIAAALAPSVAFAQTAHRPFSVGASEGGGPADGFVGWLLAEQSRFTHAMSAALKALHTDPSAAWTLVAFGFAYGVFHAAGPGHGKAVIASYMLADDRSLKRGLVLAALAALLQAIVAIVLVAGAAFVLGATSSAINAAAHGLELASYSGIAVIGVWLVAAKGRALVAALKTYAVDRAAMIGAVQAVGADWRTPGLLVPSGRFTAGAPSASSEDCGHEHIPDPRKLGDGFSWKAALATVVAAGARPCSGAILILVFARAQDLFFAGILASLAMAAGTAITTGSLAWIAVFAKSVALRFAGRDAARLGLVARGFEFAAALAVFALGALLFIGVAQSGA